MSVSRWVVGVSRVLLSVAKHHRFPPDGGFSWGGPVHPRGIRAWRVWRPAADTRTAGIMLWEGRRERRRGLFLPPARVQTQREFTWHSGVPEECVVSRCFSSPSFKEIISEFIRPHRSPADAPLKALGFCFSRVPCSVVSLFSFHGVLSWPGARMTGKAGTTSLPVAACPVSFRSFRKLALVRPETFSIPLILSVFLLLPPR